MFESCPSGVRVARYLDSYCNAYFDAGAKIALRRLTYADRPPALLCFNQTLTNRATDAGPSDTTCRSRR